MKKIFSLFAAILFAGSIFAAEVVYKTASFTAANCTSSKNYSGSSITCTVGTDSWAIVNAANNDGGWDYIRMGQKKANSTDSPKVTTSTISTDAALADPVTKIVITGSKLRGSFTSKLIIASDADFTANKVEIDGPTAFTEGALTITVTSPVANRFYQLELVCTNTTTTNGVLQLDKVDYYHQSSEKVLTADPVSIDFGNVFTGATVAAKKVKVNFANLTGAVTYSGLSDPFSATGTIAADGDEITISASSTATAGESNQTLIIQSAADSKSVEVTVHINVEDSIHPVSVDLDEHNLTVEAGTRQRLIGAIMPANCTDPTLLWETSNAEVATVTKGSVLGVAAGSATITCKSHDDATKKDECSVTVTAALPKFVIDAGSLTSTATTEATDVVYTAVTDNTKILTVTFSEGAKIQGSTGDLKFADQAILIGKTGKHINNKTALPGKITKFEIYYNKGAATGATASLSFGTSILTAAKETPDATLTFEELDKVYDVTSSVPDGSTFFWYQVTNEKNTQVQFRIYYQATPTAIDETEAAGKATKELREGQVLIIKGNKTYNILGQEIR